MASQRMRAATSILSVIATAIFAHPAAAVDLPTLSNIAGDDLKTITHTFAAAIMFKPLEPASNFGIRKGADSKKWGLAVGIQAGEVTAIKMGRFYSGSVGILPSAMSVVAVGLPHGLGAEFGAWPRLSFSNLAFEEYGGNAKWTFTDMLWRRRKPFHLALRTGITSAGINFSQTISGVQTAIDFNTTIFTASLAASKEFGFIEPYIEFGYFRQSSTLEAEGSATVFNTSLTATSKAEAATQHMLFRAGFQMRLLLLALSMEYNDVGGVNGYALKLGLKI